MDALLADLRYALRSFARSPALVAAAVVCLALGIGANATIFGVVDTLLFRPPPHVLDPERVVRLYFRRRLPPFGTTTSSITGYPLYTLIRESARSFDALAAYTYSQKASLGRGVDARRVRVVLASASYFPLLGVRPALGRFYLADEDRPDGPAVVVLGYGFWRAAFHGDSGILGRQLQLGRSSYTVVGVAPERFTGVNLENVDAWVPLTASTPELMGPGSLNRGSYFLQIIGRLGPGGREAAEREATLAFRAEDVYSGGDSNAVALLGPVQHARGPELSQNARGSMWLTAVSVIVLLVACANVANLLLARALQRQREIAVRLALGAARLRLARQLVTESVLLALAGGVAALLVTLWVGPVIRAFLLPDIPALASAVDGRVLLFTGGVALLTGFLAGLVPALQVGRADLTPALRAAAGEGRYRRSRLRSALLVGQVALTVTLIVGAGLFARSLRNVAGQDFGFDPAHTLLATMDLRAAGYRPAQINQLNLQMLARLEGLPGVDAAAATIGHFGWATASSVSVPGRDSIPQLKAGGPYYQRVTAGYFAAMGTPVHGRAFTPADRGSPVAIVNETMARLLWPGEAAIGKCFVGSDKRCAEIVGVVPDARRFNAVEEASMHFYVPFTPDSSEFITALVVRARGGPHDLVAPVRAAMQQTAANLPYAAVTPLADLVAPSIRPWRLGTTMFGLFAGLALVLAAVGLYSVLSYTVGQRSHEIGIRMAMGARRGNVLGLMVGQGVKIAALGAGIGAVAALAGGRVRSWLLFGVSPGVPVVLLVAAALPVVVRAP